MEYSITDIIASVAKTNYWYQFCWPHERSQMEKQRERGKSECATWGKVKEWNLFLKLISQESPDFAFKLYLCTSGETAQGVVKVTSPVIPTQTLENFKPKTKVMWGNDNHSDLYIATERIKMGGKIWNVTWQIQSNGNPHPQVTVSETSWQSGGSK